MHIGISKSKLAKGAPSARYGFRVALKLDRTDIPGSLHHLYLRDVYSRNFETLRRQVAYFFLRKLDGNVINIYV